MYRIIYLKRFVKRKTYLTHQRLTEGLGVSSLIAYLQPFADGNKRTGRLMVNALLLSNLLVSLSYRSIDESDHKNAIPVFYELNSILPMKKIFIEQYDFAA